MKQNEISRIMNVTPQWWCAVVNGRADAGKDLAEKASSMIGGTMADWMLEKKRTARKKIVSSYVSAFRKAKNGGAR